MKILHTSDWHIGKRLGSVSRLNEQKDVLTEICDIADEQSVDAIVVAGDVFDTFNPPTEAIELFYATVKRLSLQGKRPVFVIAGNHDSPDRIEAPNPLARDNGVFLFGYPKSEYSLFTHETGSFRITKSEPGFIECELASKECVRLIVAPFANEHRMSEAFIEHESQTLQESLKGFWKDIADRNCDSNGVNIFVGHHLMLAHMSDEIVEPDDEKPIMAISELLPVSILPPQIQYAALGHLHRYQIVADSPKVVYSGSPCAYSFSEALQKKYVSIITIAPGKEPQVNKHRLHKARVLVKKKCESVADALVWLAQNQDVYVELTVCSHTYLSPAEIQTLNKAHAGIIYIIPHILQQNTEENKFNNRVQNRPIHELFCEYFEFKTGQKPHDDIIELFSEIRSSHLD